MKVAVTSQGKELSSEIDPRFGRAKWLLVVDTQTGLSEAYDNTVNLNLVQGAGIQTGQNVVNLGVEAVITRSGQYLRKSTIFVKSFLDVVARI